MTGVTDAGIMQALASKSCTLLNNSLDLQNAMVSSTVITLVPKIIYNTPKQSSQYGECNGVTDGTSASYDRKHTTVMYVEKTKMPLKCYLEVSYAHSLMCTYETTMSVYMSYMNSLQSTI